MTIWAPGMRCVCVKEFVSPRKNADREATPVVGTVYTVRSVKWAESLGSLALQFVEIVNPVLRYRSGYAEMSYNSTHFRPLSETRLDQFRKHLNRIPADEVLA